MKSQLPHKIKKSNKQERKLIENMIIKFNIFGTLKKCLNGNTRYYLEYRL